MIGPRSSSTKKRELERRRRRMRVAEGASMNGNELITGDRSLAGGRLLVTQQ